MADFINAIKRPDIAFIGLRPDLVDGRPVLNKQGKPRSARGGFGCVLKFETFSPHKIWAIKCYNVLPPDLENHYQEVTGYLATSAIANYFLEISFSKCGIRCNGKVYPILKMEWAKGSDLRTFLSNNLNDSYKLKSLAEEWMKLCQYLTQYSVAHGDLQHENIYVMEENGNISIKLIDYDSLYLASGGKVVKDVIKGVEGYQHPQRQKINKRCIQIDYFSHLVIYLNILTFAEDASLWRSLDLHTDEKKDNLLFSLKDFENPRGSNIFTTLSSRFSPEIVKLVSNLEKMCQTDIHLIPDLLTLSGNASAIAAPQRVIPGNRKKQIFRPSKPKTISKESLRPSPTPTPIPPDRKWKPKPKPSPKPPTSRKPIPQIAPTTTSRDSQRKFPSRVPVIPKTAPSKAHQVLLISVATGFALFALQGVPVIFNSIQKFSSSITSVIDGSLEEQIRVKQLNKGKVYRNKIYLRKKYISELQKQRSMLFWVEYPNSYALRKTEDGTVNVLGVLHLWKYTGGTSPQANDRAGSVTHATLVPYERYGSFVESPTQKKQAWLVRLRLDETPL